MALWSQTRQVLTVLWAEAIWPCPLLEQYLHFKECLHVHAFMLGNRVQRPLMVLMRIIADITSRVNASCCQILIWNVIEVATCINDLLSYNLLGGSIGKNVTLYPCWAFTLPRCTWCPASVRAFSLATMSIRRGSWMHSQAVAGCLIAFWIDWSVT